MKKRFYAILLGLCLIGAVPANAQFNWGIKAGADFSGKTANIAAAKEGYSGWYAGPMAKFVFPVIGLGLEANALYSNSGVTIGEEKFNKNSVEIPVYLRYELRIPAISRVIAPFIAVGPQWGYVFGKKEFGNDISKVNNLDEAKDVYNKYFKFNESNFSLNLGLGFVFFNHVQVHANYNIALGQTYEYIGAEKYNLSDKIEGIKAKNNLWQVSLAYIF